MGLKGVAKRFKPSPRCTPILISVNGPFVSTFFVFHLLMSNCVQSLLSFRLQSVLSFPWPTAKLILNSRWQTKCTVRAVDDTYPPVESLATSACSTLEDSWGTRLAQQVGAETCETISLFYIPPELD